MRVSIVPGKTRNAILLYYWTYLRDHPKVPDKRTAGQQGLVPRGGAPLQVGLGEGFLQVRRREPLSS